ncbi:MAG: hypothetical protein ACI8Y7_000719 [Candidatus Woesearchaeota archaeon]|jgi:hypothetical protein
MRTWLASLPSEYKDWTPQVYDIALIFDQEKTYQKLRGDDSTAVLTYGSITDEMVDRVPKEEKRRIESFLLRSTKFAGMKKALANSDAKHLSRYVFGSFKDGHLSNFGGHLAEAIAVMDLRVNLMTNMNLLSNKHLAVLNNSGEPGDELDGILTFYGKENLAAYLKQIAGSPNVAVGSRLDGNFYSKVQKRKRK